MWSLGLGCAVAAGKGRTDRQASLTLLRQGTPPALAGLLVTVYNSLDKGENTESFKH